MQTVPFSVPSCRGTKIEISNLIFNHRLMKITILMKNVIILHEAVCDAAAPSYTVGEEEGDDEVNGAPLSDAASEPLPELSDPDPPGLALFPEALLPELPPLPEPLLPESPPFPEPLLLALPPFPEAMLLGSPPFPDPWLLGSPPLLWFSLLGSPPSPFLDPAVEADELDELLDVDSEAPGPPIEALVILSIVVLVGGIV